MALQMSWYSFKPYVPVAQRRAQAARELAKLSKKDGLAASPVLLEGRKIASTFWGKAWCDNLEAYSDFENRLPRGRTYVRNGSVVHLEVTQGKVTARVSGSSLYKIEIKIKPLAPTLWKSIQNECAGKIDSLIELLQGKLSSSVMQIVTRPERGLFPTPKEIELDCSCPDWADLCGSTSPLHSMALERGWIKAQSCFSFFAAWTPPISSARHPPPKPCASHPVRKARLR